MRIIGMAKILIGAALAVSLGGCGATAVVGAAASVVGAAVDVTGSVVSGSVDVVSSGVSGAIDLATSDDVDADVNVGLSPTASDAVYTSPLPVHSFGGALP